MIQVELALLAAAVAACGRSVSLLASHVPSGRGATEGTLITGGGHGHAEKPHDATDIESPLCGHPRAISAHVDL